MGKFIDLKDYIHLPELVKKANITYNTPYLWIRTPLIKIDKQTFISKLDIERERSLEIIEASKSCTDLKQMVPLLLFCKYLNTTRHIINMSNKRLKGLPFKIIKIEKRYFVKVDRSLIDLINKEELYFTHLILDKEYELIEKYDIYKLYKKINKES